MKLFLFLILIIALVGCTETVIKEHNNTIFINNTIIKEISNPCICQEKACNQTTKIIYINNTVAPDTTCNGKLTTCYYNQQRYFKLYQECLMENNSKKVQNLTYQLNKKTWQFNNCSGVLNNITKIMRR